MDKDALTRLLREVLASPDEESSLVCLPLPRLRTGVLRENWGEDELSHLASCIACQRARERMDELVWHPTVGQLARHTVHRLGGDDELSLRAHLEDDRCRCCRAVHARIQGSRDQLPGAWLEEMCREHGVWFRGQECPAALRLVAESVGAILDAEHVSSHFLVSKSRLVAPRSMCFTCHVPCDITTDLDASSGLTAFMVRHPGLYNLSRDDIAAFARERGNPKPSLFTPVYSKECTSLLCLPVYLDGQLAGLVKVENRRHTHPTIADQPGARFDRVDEVVLRRIVDEAKPLYAEGLAWAKEHFPRPEVQLFPAA